MEAPWIVFIDKQKIAMTNQNTLQDLLGQLEDLRKENLRLKEVINQQKTLAPEHFSCQSFCDTLPFAIHTSGLGLWSVDLRTLAVNWSQEMCAILGLDRSTFILNNDKHFSTNRFLEFVHPDDRQRVETAINKSISNRQQFNSIHRMLHTDGHYKWIHSIGDCAFSEDGTPIHMTGFVWDISEHKSVEEHLRELTITDALTGLYNRRHLANILEQELRYGKRFGTEVSVISIDIDHFKNINDNFGHEMGDRFLKTMAKLMKQTFRDVDFLFRWGGEEFISVLPNVGVKEARIAAERLRQAFANINIDGAQTTLSGGVASSKQISPDASSEELLEASDQALYQAKNTGRNRIQTAIRQTEAARL